MNPILEDVRQQLIHSVDPKTKETGQNFFKEKVTLYGVKIPLVNKISQETFAVIKDLDKAEIFALCAELWRSGIMEEAFVACHWSYFLKDDYQPQDFAVFEKWVDSYVDNWATCDTLCNHTVGAFLEKFPRYVPELKRWAASPERWVRRGAAVSFIIPARNGLFLDTIFEIAGILLLDEDDLVQKGYGWMLKAASQAQQTAVFDYVMKNKARMPRTALRYAIEKMPAGLKAKAMEK